MDIQKLKDMLESEMAGRAIGLVASYCVEHNNLAAIRKFQEFASDLFQTFTEKEREELRDLIETMMQKRAEKVADTLTKTISKEDVAQLVGEIAPASIPNSP